MGVSVANILGFENALFGLNPNLKHRILHIPHTFPMFDTVENNRITFCNNQICAPSFLVFVFLGLQS